MVLILLRPSCGVVQRVNQIWMCLDTIFPMVHEAASISSPLDGLLQGSHDTCTPKSLGIISGKAEGEAHRGQISLIAFYPFSPHQKWLLEW